MRCAGGTLVVDHEQGPAFVEHVVATETTTPRPQPRDRERSDGKRNERAPEGARAFVDVDVVQPPRPDGITDASSEKPSVYGEFVPAW